MQVNVESLLLLSFIGGNNNGIYDAMPLSCAEKA